jgi:hypothetical protein
MNSLFEPTSAAEIISRLSALQPSAQPHWGKMNAAQMMAHCQAPFEVYFGERKLQRPLIGRLFGKLAKKKLFSSEPWPHNLPTAKSFKVPDRMDFISERARLVQMIGRFAQEGYTIHEQTHPLFGKMSSQEWALFAYRHMDHHLQQFGV